MANFLELLASLSWGTLGKLQSVYMNACVSFNVEFVSEQNHKSIEYSINIQQKREVCHHKQENICAGKSTYRTYARTTS